MNDNLKRWSKTALIYMVVIIVAVVATHFYHQYKTDRYIQAYKDAGGQQVLSDIADTYKMVVERYSNYRLGTDTKAKMVQELGNLAKELAEVDRQINQNNSIDHKINFSFIYHDMKLVRLSLSDATKDDIIPVIVLHASEGLKELEKEIMYIEYR
jgi:hypothetical protein